MHSSSISFFALLALALSAAASPVAPRQTVAQNELKAGGRKGGKFGGAAGKGAGKGGAAGAANAAPPAAAAGAANAAGAGAANAAGAAAAPPAAAADPQALQTSTTIDPSVIQTTDDGQNPPVDGQSAADVSKNNFANACALGLPQVPLTNGLQITTGSCNPIPIGQIPSVDNMPSSKFQSPKNLDTIASNVTFNIVLATKGIQLGTFTNAQKTYFGNPQKLNTAGQIIGHTHIVMETIDSLTTTAVTDPTKFFFFKGVNTAQDAKGNVEVEVTGGVSPGAYRMCTIVSSATHQPAIVPVAQHGSLDDCVYFTATPGGAAAAPAAAAGGAAVVPAAAAGSAAAAGAAASNAGGAAASPAAGQAAKGGKTAAGNAKGAKGANANGAKGKAGKA